MNYDREGLSVCWAGMRGLGSAEVSLDHLDNTTQEKVRKVIQDNLDAFAKTSEDVGCVPYHLYHASIYLEPGKYAYSNDYKLNYKERIILKKMEERLVRQGVLAPNKHAPVHRSINMLVKKPGARILNMTSSRLVTDL